MILDQAALLRSLIKDLHCPLTSLFPKEGDIEFGTQATYTKHSGSLLVVKRIRDGFSCNWSNQIFIHLYCLFQRNYIVIEIQRLIVNCVNIPD